MKVHLQSLSERVCQSETFRPTKRLQEFLRYLVGLQKTDSVVKESLIGVEFFGRNPGYDPRKDPIVRVEAHRLRRRLQEYYRREGRTEALQVDLPAGGYIPVLRSVENRTGYCRLAVRVQAADDITAEGLTAELIYNLGTLHGIRVLAPSSSLIAQRSHQPVEELGVDTVLDCRLQGTNLHATLSRLLDGHMVRVGTFDNLIQPAVDALTQFVASKIGVQHRRRAEGARMDLTTYQKYLAGRAWFHRWSADNLVRAEECFQQVLERMPEFAPAYSGLADIQILRAYWHTGNPRPVLELGQAYSQKAAELEAGSPATRGVPGPAVKGRVPPATGAAVSGVGESADVHCSRGALAAVLDHDWERAEHEFRSALDVNPSYALALNWLAIIALVPQQRFAEAVDTAFAACDLDPASPEIGNEIVWVRICCGQYSEAAEQARLIRELYPGFLETYWSLAVAETCCDHHGAACAALDEADRVHPSSPMTLALRCFAEGRRGNLEAARAALTRLESLTDPVSTRPILRSWAHAAVGDLDRGFRFLEDAVEAADPHALYVHVFPPNAPLRKHPSYREILKRQRLPA